MSALTDKIAKVIGEKIFTANIDKNDLSELIKEIAVIAEAGGEPAYKVYTALLSQSGTSAPTATILENTLGGTITWTYSDVGIYNGTLTGAFVNNKTSTEIGSVSSGGDFASLAFGIIHRVNADTLEVVTLNNSSIGENGDLLGTKIEIRVYN